MALADRIAVMDKGRLLQVDSPRTLYREPSDDVVARFVGAGMILPAAIAGRSAEGLFDVDVLGHRARVRGGGQGASGRLCVRAHDLALTSDPDGLAGRVERVVYQGGRYLIDVAVAHEPSLKLCVEAADGASVSAGDHVRIAIRDGWLLPG
jgi:iron(III) transport system ATP-binding protein